MAKLLRVMVVLLLLLSITSLVLGSMLFLRREEQRGRNEALEKAVLDIAATIERGGEGEDALSPVEISADQLKAFYGVDASGQKVVGGEGSMQQALSDLVGKAVIQRNRLSDTRSTLGLAQEQLTETKGQLAQTQQELSDAKGTIAEQKKEIDSLQAAKIRAEELEKKVAEMEDKERELAAQLEERNAAVQDREEKLRDLEGRFDLAQKDILDLRRELAVAKAQGAGGAEVDVVPMVTPGLKGRIEMVSPEWNFVVMSLVKNAHVVQNANLLVHRDDALVGKIRILEVKSDLNAAIADILPEWLQEGQIREGDYVIF